MPNAFIPPVPQLAEVSAVHWCLSPAGGVDIENIADLFTEAQCGSCLVPLGRRTRRRMRVRYDDPDSRRYDGALAQLPERPTGPTFNLFSERFLALLSRAEQRSLRWRAVDVSNPTKSTIPLYELVGSTCHAPAAALRGGDPTRTSCDACGRLGPPDYSSSTALPKWARATDWGTTGDHPTLFAAASAVPEPVPSFFALGDWHDGVQLIVASERSWPEPRPRGTTGIQAFPVAVVSDELIEPSDSVNLDDHMVDKRDKTHPNADAFPPGLSGPALRALAHAKIKSMNDLSKWTEDALGALHGMGPKGIRMLKDGLAKRGRSLRGD